MTREESRIAYANVAYLCGRAVNGEKPDADRIRNMNLKHLFHAADFHMLAAACAMALESAGVKEEAFTGAKGRALRKIALLEREKEAILSRLEEEKIWYMPLKGAVMQDLYPVYGMREMTDMDILFDPSCRERVKAIMEERGFTADRYGIDNHDCYQKPPLYNFEMHTALVDPAYGPESAAYYETVSSRLLRDDPDRVGRHFSKEDFYVFLLSHGYKHYRMSGIGLRFLLDIYVYLMHYADSLDRAYIETELAKMGLLAFEKETRELAGKLYDGIPLTREETVRLDFYLFSGAQGTGENLLARAIERYGEGKKGKAKYVFYRIFLPLEEIKVGYPTVYRHKILVPLLPFYRIGKALLTNRGRVKKEFKQLKKK